MSAIPSWLWIVFTVAASGAQTARILRPGQIITKEYDTQRLNLEVDGTGRILAAKCG